MKFRHLIIIIFFFYSINLAAQLADFNFGNALSAPLGNATVALQGKNALFNNPAGLMNIKSKTALINSIWMYGLKDLAPISCGYVQPTHSGIFGVSLLYWGFENIKMTHFNVNYARSLSSRLDAGINMSFAHNRFVSTGSENNVGFSLGVNTLIINNLRLGFIIKNPFYIKRQSDISSAQYAQLRLGLAYSLSNYLVVSTEVKKDVHSPISFRWGTAYTPLSKLTLKCGFETNPIKLGFGFGLQINDNWVADFAASSHSVLGITPALSMSYIFKNMK